MSPLRAKFSRIRHGARWLLPAALLALVPKCLVCLAAYTGLGAALGLGGPEICGAAAGSAMPRASWLAVSGVMLGVIGLAARFRCLRARPETEAEPLAVSPPLPVWAQARCAARSKRPGFTAPVNISFTSPW